MRRDNSYNFVVERAISAHGFYWLRAKGDGEKGLTPLKRSHMAVDVYTMVAHRDGASHDYNTENQWAPLTKTMKAFYLMMSEPEREAE